MWVGVVNAFEFPTRVGMNRARPAGRIWFFRVPHASGDEPLQDGLNEAIRRSSPREWG